MAKPLQWERKQRVKPYDRSPNTPFPQYWCLLQ